jgi:tellurite resistance protein
MSNPKISSKLSEEQLSVWLRGLLSVASADNEYSQKEQDLIQELLNHNQITDLEPIKPSEIATVFGNNATLAQNFLRTAVMVALVDGNYSDTEHKLIQEFCTALNQELNIMTNLRNQLESPHENHHDPLDPVKEWLDHLDIHDSKIARFLCKVIPAQCPFERDIFVFGRKVAHIPAMCKINPLYDQLVGLRFRSLSYLVDECGEDISEFC